MEKQLAIDCTVENYDECLRYSKLIREAFGLKTFSLEDLKQALYQLPKKESIYIANKFHLFENDEKDEFESLSSVTWYNAKISLKELDKKFHFLTKTKIKYLHERDNYLLSEKDYSPILELKVQDLEFSSRAKNVFRQNSIITLEDLTSRTIYELSRLRNLGSSSIFEIKETLKKYDLELN